MAKKVVLAGACRTAIGKMGGALSTTPAPELGSIVIKEALNRAGVPADQVDHVYMGCVIQAGLRTERSSSGFSQSWTSYRDTCSYSKRCLWIRSELCKHGSTDDSYAGRCRYCCCRWNGEHVHGSLCYDARTLVYRYEQWVTLR